MILILILALFVLLPTILYILVDHQILVMVLRPSNKKVFNDLFQKITAPIFVLGSIITFLICFPLIHQYWGILNAIPIILSYLVIVALIQGILFIIIVPEHIHRPTKAVLPITIMANGIGIVVILVAMPFLLWSVGMLYSFWY